MNAVPAAVRWYANYCRFVAAVAALAACGGAWVVVGREDVAEALGVEPFAIAWVGGLWALTWIFFAFVHVAALKTPPAAWAWRLHTVIIGMGLTTLVLWPLALPLLYYWVKPNVRAYHEGTAPA